ncbi:hypothetical protein LTR53_015872 [Teratosphaeriaceae sp. CCFEE 6253]|nr:hypothetical protein LTR53_015872 [Teratosphaeriaceae sp. CCFEE 6253]
MDQPSQPAPPASEQPKPSHDEERPLPPHPIIAFYHPAIQAPYAPGRPATTFQDILHWPDAQLESTHDYIQWLFPVPEASGASWSAPVLTAKVRDSFRENADLQANMVRACERMMAFWGFELDDDPRSAGEHRFRPHSHFQRAASDSWLQKFDHNHLRITRVIRSLRILGRADLAQSMMLAIFQEERRAGNPVGKRTLTIWHAALDRPTRYPPTYPAVPVCDWLVDAEE